VEALAIGVAIESNMLQYSTLSVIRQKGVPQYC